MSENNNVTGANSEVLENKQEINFDLSNDVKKVTDDEFFDDFFNDE